MFTARREYQLDSFDILLRYSAGRLAAMEKRTTRFLFWRPSTCERETSAFLMSTCLFPNSLEYQFLLWYCFTCLLPPGYRGVSLTNTPATNLLSPLVALINIWTTVCKAVTTSVRHDVSLKHPRVSLAMSNRNQWTTPIQRWIIKNKTIDILLSAEEERLGSHA